MATKTMILRPTAMLNTDSFTGYAGGVETELSHLLVSEEVADDDATYITSKASATSPTNGFLFTKPQNIVPTNIRIVCRVKSSTASSSCAIFYNKESGVTRVASPSVSTTYQNESYALPSADLTEFWKIINSTDTFHISFCSGTGVNDKSTAYTTSLTQLFLEVDYEEAESEDPILYVKANGVFSPISGDVYKKINDSWMISDTSVFNDGDKFKLQTIN